MAERDTDLDELNRQHALRAHQVHYSYLDKGNEAAISSGQAAVKNLFLMHGGALVAMMTFTSGILTNNGSTVRADGLVDPMMRFALGLAVAGPLGSVQGQHEAVVDFVKDGGRQAGIVRRIGVKSAHS